MSSGLIRPILIGGNSMYWVEYKRPRQRTWLCVALAPNKSNATELVASLEAQGLMARMVKVTA